MSSLPHEAKSNIWFYMGGSGLDRTDECQTFCASGLDRIQFYRIRTGLELKIYTVRSSFVLSPYFQGGQMLVLPSPPTPMIVPALRTLIHDLHKLIIIATC